LFTSSCVGAALASLEVASAALLRLRPIPTPAPRPTRSATMPVITTGATGKLLPDVAAGVLVVAVGLAVTLVAPLAALGLTVKTKAPSSGSPSSDETVIQRTT